MATIHQLPEVGRITLKAERAKVAELPWAWRIPWVDVQERKHVTLVPGPIDLGNARLSVGTYCEGFYEFLGEPTRVVYRSER